MKINENFTKISRECRQKRPLFSSQEHPLHETCTSNCRPAGPRPAIHLEPFERPINKTPTSSPCRHHPCPPPLRDKQPKPRALERYRYQARRTGVEMWAALRAEIVLPRPSTSIRPRVRIRQWGGTLAFAPVRPLRPLRALTCPRWIIKFNGAVYGFLFGGSTGFVYGHQFSPMAFGDVAVAFVARATRGAGDGEQRKLVMTVSKLRTGNLQQSCLHVRYTADKPRLGTKVKRKGEVIIHERLQMHKVCT